MHTAHCSAHRSRRAFPCSSTESSQCFPFISPEMTSRTLPILPHDTIPSATRTPMFTIACSETFPALTPASAIVSHRPSRTGVPLPLPRGGVEKRSARARCDCATDATATARARADSAPSRASADAVVRRVSAIWFQHDGRSRCAAPKCMRRTPTLRKIQIRYYDACALSLSRRILARIWPAGRR